MAQGAELTPARALSLLAMLAPSHPTGHSLATPCGHKPAVSWPKPTAPSHLGESSQVPCKHPAFGYVGQEGSATSVTLTTAPCSIPWMHSVLEQIQGDLGVPCKAQHHPSFIACLQSPCLLPAPAVCRIPEPCSTTPAPSAAPTGAPSTGTATLCVPHCPSCLIPSARDKAPARASHTSGTPAPFSNSLALLSLCFLSYSPFHHAVLLPRCLQR